MNTSRIIVYVNRQLDGVTFGLDPLSRKQLHAAYPKKSPGGSVYVGYDSKANFESYHNRVEPTILPVLLGMSEQEIVQLGEIDFIDPKTNELLFRYANE